MPCVVGAKPMEGASLFLLRALNRAIAHGTRFEAKCDRAIHKSPEWTGIRPEWRIESP